MANSIDMKYLRLDLLLSTIDNIQQIADTIQKGLQLNCAGERPAM